MTALRRTATAALATFVTVLAVPVVSAEAAAKPLHFETLSSVSGGKVQACRIPTKASEPVLLKLRLDATKASQRLNASGQATHSGKSIGQGWKSGWVGKGTRSSIGTVRVPRGAGYQLVATIAASQLGNGGSFTATSIRTCS
jgi:hypothetical protein